MVVLPWAVTFFFHDKIVQTNEITLNVSDHLVGHGSAFLLKFTLIYLSTTGCSILLICLSLFTLYQFAPGWPQKIKFEKLWLVFSGFADKNKNLETVLDEDLSTESTHTDAVESTLEEKTEMDNIVDTLVNDTDGEEKETPNTDKDFTIKKTTPEAGIAVSYTHHRTQPNT